MGEKTRVASEKAAKFAQKGQNKKAIKEYEKLLEAKPDDVRLLQRLAELWARVGDKKKAIDFFLQAAAGHSGKGFSDRAVAIYKQALMVDSSHYDANLRLAEEFQKKGFDRDAVYQLLKAGAAYEKAGKDILERKILLKAVELFPDDVDCHMHLARFHVRTDEVSEAREEFQRAAIELKNANRLDEFITVAQQVIQLGEVKLEFYHSLTECYLDRGEWNNALKVVEKAMYVQSDDFYILELSARAHLGAEKPSRAAMVYKRIARIARLLGDDQRAQEAQAKIEELTPKETASPKYGPPPIPKKRPAKKTEPQPEQLPEELGYDDDDEPTGEAEPYQQQPGDQALFDDKKIVDEMIEGEPTEDRPVANTTARDEDIAGLMAEDALSEEEPIDDLPEWQDDARREFSGAELDTGEGDSPFDSDDKDEKTMLVAISDLFSEVTASHEPDRKPIENKELDKKLAEGLDVSDFFVGQGLLDDAADILNDLSEEFKDHPEVVDRLEEITRLRGIAQADDDVT
jgi:tetratricopeptide (TPR) repeat protein